MTRDWQQYWREIREIEASLPQFAWVVSVENPKRGITGGSLAQVTAANGAKLLHSGSHRLATEEEIREHQAGEEEVKKHEFHEKLRKRGIAMIPVNGGSGTALR